jgi:zinc protease
MLSGYSGRLNQEIRVKRGLSYGAGAQLVARRMNGSFIASTLVDHARAPLAVEVVLETLASLIQTPPTEAELGVRKTSLLGGWNRAIETNDGLLAALTDYALYRIPLDELERYTARVEATDSAQVAAFAREYVVPDSCIVLVGDASMFADGLEKLTPDVRIVPFAELDLDRSI